MANCRSSITDYIYKRSTGQRTQLEKVPKTWLDTCKFQVQNSAAPFTTNESQKLVYSMAWHPSNAHLLAAGSEKGRIALLNDDLSDLVQVGQGERPEKPIRSLKFCKRNANVLLSSSTDGKIYANDLQANTCSVFFNTNEVDRLPTSLDVSEGMMASGDSRGSVHLLSTSGNEICNFSPHAGEVDHIEFNVMSPWILATSSTDGIVKLWDVRKLDEVENIGVLPHDPPATCACFSPSIERRLLTKSQDNVIKVFRGPAWNLETSIEQTRGNIISLNNTKALWHPHEEIIVAGRYPAPMCPDRYIDFFDAADGKLMRELRQRDVAGVITLAQFNANVSALVSCIMSEVSIWRPE